MYAVHNIELLEMISNFLSLKVCSDVMKFIPSSILKLVCIREICTKRVTDLFAMTFYSMISNNISRNIGENIDNKYLG